MIEEKKAAKKAAQKAAEEEAAAAREEQMAREIRETLGNEGGAAHSGGDGEKTEAEEDDKDQDKNDRDREGAESPSLGSLMPTIEVHKTPVLDMNARQRPEIPGGEKFSLMLRKNTANHLRKREEQLLEARRYKEDPQVSQNYFHDKLLDWDRGEEAFPDDVASMVSTLSFDYVRARQRNKTYNEEGLISYEEEQEEEEKGGKEGEGKILLPVNHDKIYEENQRKILKQKTLVLKRAHYQNYPNFHKDPSLKEYDPSKDLLRDPTALEDNRRMHGDRFAFNDHCLSPGEKIFSLRQAFDHVGRGEMDVRTANNGRDDSSIDPRYTTVVRTPMTPASLEKAKLLQVKDDEKGEKDTEMLRREKEEAERASSIAAKMRVLQQEDQVILQALQHHKREQIEAELKDMAANWSEEMKRFDEEKKKNNTSLRDTE